MVPLYVASKKHKLILFIKNIMIQLIWHHKKYKLILFIKNIIVQLIWCLYMLPQKRTNLFYL